MNAKKRGNTISLSRTQSPPTMEKCCICLSPLGNQKIGRPRVCSHTFCAQCIISWSESAPVCPLDRKPMEAIEITQNGQFVRDHQVAAPRARCHVRAVEAEEFIEDAMNISDINCATCGTGSREIGLLVCDVCGRAYHLECLNPPLRETPTEYRNCPTCQSVLIRR